MPRTSSQLTLRPLAAAAAALLLGLLFPAPAVATTAPSPAAACLDVPTSPALVSASSCAQPGPVTTIAAGAVPGSAADGAVVLTTGQSQVRRVVSGSGPLSVVSVAQGSACLADASGRLRVLSLTDASLTGTTACPASTGAAQGPPTSAGAATPGETRASTATTAEPAPTASYYVYASDVSTCVTTSGSGCPLYQEGVYTAAPGTGALVVLDFGAPCYVPSSSPTVYGTQLFGSKGCTPLPSLVPATRAFIAGYESTHGAGTPLLTLALGTSNSLTGADPPSYALTASQMQAHGAAWFSQVVNAVPSSGLAAPVVLWGGSDIEEAGDGNWYDPTVTTPWVQAYGTAAGGRKGCSPSTPGFMLDYGDDPVGGGPSTVGGWSVQQVYQVAWGLPETCALPEIYYDGLAQEWVAMNSWAASNGLPKILFTGVMAEPGAGLTPQQAYDQLESLSAQSPAIQFLTTINSSLVAPPPAVSSLSPGSGPPGGGTSVVVTGTDFINVSSVSFGGTPASSFSVTSQNQLTAVSPPLAPGTVSVVVTAAAGSSASTGSSQFTAGSSGAYRALTPGRILDTRAGSGAPGAGQTLGPGATLSLQVAGQGGVPSTGAAAVVLNLTAVGPTSAGFLTVYPSGGSRPNASNLNFARGQTVANLVEVPLPQNGQVVLYNGLGSVDAVADVQGWVGAAGTGTGLYTPLTPARIFDTRAGSGYPGAGQTPGPNGAVDIQVTGRGGIPGSGVAAVVINLTATGPTSAGFLTAYPSGAGRPLASNLNFTAGETVPNLVEVPVGSGGKVSVYNPFGSTDVVADVEGWVSDGTATPAAGTSFSPLPPARILDTRPGSGLPGAGQTLGGGGTLAIQVAGRGGVPSTARAVVVNVTVTDTTVDGFLTVYPAGAARPGASNLNFTAGQTAANLVVVPLGSGSITAYNLAGSTDVVVDVEGYYS